MGNQRAHLHITRKHILLGSTKEIVVPAQTALPGDTQKTGKLNYGEPKEI